jgi:hypothetical protein
MLVEAEYWIYGIAISKSILDEALPFLHIYSELLFGGEGGFLEPAR